VPGHRGQTSRLRSHGHQARLSREEKGESELWSLAVSAINGCGTCIDAHEKALKAADVPAAAIQAAARFAAIIQSVALTLEATAVEMPAAAE
jgi:lipoyl-dependent peroxiredoxin subunit D